MGDRAYACRVKRSNFGAIISEHPKSSLDEIHAWLQMHGDGYFIRDEEHESFDCTFMPLDLFEVVYRFVGFRPNEMFHPIEFS